MNAVAAKARKRMEHQARAETALEAEIKRGQRVPKPRISAADVTIQIRDHGARDSLTLNLHRAPWPNQWTCPHGVFSSAKLGRVIAELLKSASETAGRK